MSDREKVIECLQKAKMVIETWVPMFEQYNTPAGIDDAIALLKEQEASWISVPHKKARICSRCKFADEDADYIYNYCPNCGARMIKRW